jgi:hypothetical protein
MVHPYSIRISRVPTYLFAYLVPLNEFRLRDYHPLRQNFPVHSTLHLNKLRKAPPLSLAATQRISFDFFSFGYLDVSVPRVRSYKLSIHL